MRISDWSSDVCSSDLRLGLGLGERCELQTRVEVPPEEVVLGHLPTLRQPLPACAGSAGHPTNLRPKPSVNREEGPQVREVIPTCGPNPRETAKKGRRFTLVRAVVGGTRRDQRPRAEIGRAAGREGVCQYV